MGIRAVPQVQVVITLRIKYLSRAKMLQAIKNISFIVLLSMDAYEKGKDTEKKAKNLALRRERLAAMLRQERYRFEVG